MKKFICTIALSGIVFGGAAQIGRLWAHRPGGNEMTASVFNVTHVRHTTDKSFDEVKSAFERQLGRFDADVYKALAANGDTEAARARIEGMVGPSGFMLFGTTTTARCCASLARSAKRFSTSWATRCSPSK